MTKKVNGSTVSFADLLQRAQEAAGVDVESVENELTTLNERRTGLETELAEVIQQAKELGSRIQAPIRDAVKAAALLSIEVPPEYRNSATKSNGRSRSNGGYLWQAEGHEPFQAEVSRALWRISRGCGGSAGINGEGVLTVGEFGSLVKEQCGRDSLAAGEEVTVTLPNGKAVLVKRIA